MNKRKIAAIYLSAAMVFALTAFATPKVDNKKKEKNVFATFDTTEGKFKVKLYSDKSPKTVENFVSLAEGTNTNPDLKADFKGKKFYDGLIFHRVIPNFMIQGGDPLGNGTGGPGYKFADELDPSLKFNKKGILAMANSGRNTNGSQFFITVKDDLSYLNGGYTIFGEVVEGYDVVEKISRELTTADRPDKDVKIKTVKIERK